MRVFSIALLGALTGLVAGAPVLEKAAPLAKRVLDYSPFPLPDGFPAPNATALAEIEMLAGGSLPDGALPAKLSAAAAATLQLIALNEIFEVAYFYQLLWNVTNNVTGYEINPPLDRTYVIDSLAAVLAQEELHALGANGILMAANETTIEPCRYNFPVSDFISAITLANTFTDVVLSTLPTAQVAFATDGGMETGLVQLVGSIIAQEGEQNGYYRSVQQKTPSAAPFLTTGAGAFAFTFLQSAIVPGSCPNIELISAAVPTFGDLIVFSMPGETNGTVEFGVAATVAPETNSIVYLSGGNLPVTVPIGPVTSIAGISHFTASFPFMSEAQFSRGLTLAALVNGTGMTFENASAVAEVTLFGPGIIEID